MTYSTNKQYSKNGLEYFRAKDRRIAWLSIFSSLTQISTAKDTGLVEIAKVANELTDNLFKNYADPDNEKEIDTGTFDDHLTETKRDLPF